jgi:hypothetical protein
MIVPEGVVTKCITELRSIQESTGRCTNPFPNYDFLYHYRNDLNPANAPANNEVENYDRLPKQSKECPNPPALW